MTSSSSSGSWLSTGSPRSAAATTTAKACCAWGQVKSWLRCRAPAPSSVRRGLVVQQRAHRVGELVRVVDEHAGAPVGHRLAGAAGRAVGDGRASSACRPRRSPGPSPPSARGAAAARRARRSRACAPRRPGPRTPRCHRRRAPRRRRAARPPTSRCPRRAAAARELSSRSASDGVDGVLDLLVRHQPADHRDRRVRGLAGVDVHHRVGAVVHDRDPRPADAERRGARRGWRARPRRTAVPVEPRREPALDPPAHLGRPPRVDDRPLLAVDVVHQHDHRRPGHQAGEEGEPVLDVDDEVDGAEPAARAATASLRP